MAERLVKFMALWMLAFAALVAVALAGRAHGAEPRTTNAPPSPALELKVQRLSPEESKGGAASLPGEVMWSLRVGAEDARVRAVAVDRGGNVIVAVGETSRGGREQLSLSKLAHDGTLRWSRRFPVENGFVLVQALVTDGADNLVLGGFASAPLALSGKPVRGNFVAKISADGQPFWARAVPFDVEALTALPGGDVAAGGRLFRAGKVAGKDLDPGIVPDLVVARIAADGSEKWAQGFGPSAGGTLRALTSDEAGQIFLGGAYSGRLRFGVHELPASVEQPYVAKLDGDGAVRWAVNLPVRPEGTRPGTGEITGLAVDADERVSMVGSFRGRLDVPDKKPLVASDSSAFVASFAADGSVRWMNALSGRPEAIALDPSGAPMVLVARSGERSDGFGLFKLDAKRGGELWTRDVSGFGDAAGAASSPTGALIVGGSPAGGGGGAMLLRLAP